MSQSVDKSFEDRGHSSSESVSESEQEPEQEISLIFQIKGSSCMSATQDLFTLEDSSSKELNFQDGVANFTP